VMIVARPRSQHRQTELTKLFAFSRFRAALMTMNILLVRFSAFKQNFYDRRREMQD